MICRIDGSSEENPNPSKLKDCQRLEDEAGNPLFGIKGNLVHFLGNLAHRCPANQTLITELDGLHLILNHFQVDHLNPCIHPWGQFTGSDVMQNGCLPRYTLMSLYCMVCTGYDTTENAQNTCHIVQKWLPSTILYTLYNMLCIVRTNPVSLLGVFCECSGNCSYIHSMAELHGLCRQVVFIKRYISVMEMLCGPAYCGLCRQVVFIKRYISVMEVLCGPAYCGLCRQVVFKRQASLYTVEMFYLWTESACHNFCQQIIETVQRFAHLGFFRYTNFMRYLSEDKHLYINLAC